MTEDPNPTGEQEKEIHETYETHEIHETHETEIHGTEIYVIEIDETHETEIHGTEIYVIEIHAMIKNFLFVVNLASLPMMPLMVQPPV
jgi:hypothetical protein